MTRPTDSQRTALSPRMWNSGWGTLRASATILLKNTPLSVIGVAFQKTVPFESTEMVMFSGLVCVGMLTAFGISTAAIFLITGTVIRKMISSTSMMSTSGVVLISEIAEPSSSSLPTLIAMSDYLWWVKRKV